jgi:hypothetical protein
MSDSLKVCNVCQIGKRHDAYAVYNAHYTHKTCRDCEAPVNKKHKPNMNAVKPIGDMSNGPQLKKSVVDMIHCAAEIANAQCTEHNITVADSSSCVKPDQKKCRECRIIQNISDFPIKDRRGTRGPMCKSCTRVSRRNGVRISRTSKNINSSAIQKNCNDCGISKPLSGFYYSGKDSKCIVCRLAYNAKYRAEKREMLKSKKSQDELDDIITGVCRDVEIAESQINALGTVRTCNAVPQATNPTPVNDDTDDELILVSVNPPIVAPTMSQKYIPCGLEKFDQIELIGIIAKVFHFEIVELKCLYNNEDIHELSLWKSQVRELYAGQNPGADEAYRRIMFDYSRAARELKNGAALRVIDSA